MKLSLNWIKELIDLPADAADTIGALTTLKVAETEAVIKQEEQLSNIIVAAVTAVNAHPKADKLRLATVDTGNGEEEVVCGAPNVAEGLTVALARVGAIIDGTELKAVKIRGIASAGMLLSERELGLSDDHSGIMELDSTCKPGTPLAEALGLDDVIIDIDNHAITHRPDLWCHRGMARELAAVYGVDAPSELETGIKPQGEGLTIEIADPDLCSRYTGAVIDNIRVEESPWELKRRLLACGIRPVYNIVDITNLVMLEMGEPMHAFDADKVVDSHIIVRRARKDESIVTLDGQKRDLTPADLIIADPEKAVALAGVMGGGNTEITDSTTRIILEAATFNHVSIRNTRLATGLQSEATNRFEKGLVPELTAIAIGRACEMIRQYVPGANIATVTDVNLADKVEKTIHLTARHVVRLTGQAIPIAESVELLTALGYEAQITDGDADVRVPYWRNRDTDIEEDLIEDIARLYGLDRLTPVLPALPAVPGSQPPLRLIEKRLRNLLAGTGAQEVQTYSFSPDDFLKPFSFANEEHFELENPLDSNMTRMRRSMLPGLLQGLRHNLPHLDEITMYEIGRVYFKKSTDREKLPDNEIAKLTLLATRRNADTVYYDVLALAQLVLDAFNISARPVRDTELPDMHPGRSACLITDEETVLGMAAELDPALTGALKIRERVGVLELDLTRLMEAAGKASIRFQPAPRFPAITREFAMISPEVIDFSEIAGAVTPLDSLIRSIELKSIYTGNPIPEGKKSIAFSVLLRDDEKTLSDEEANAVQDQIVEVLDKQLGLKLREA